MSPQSYDDEPRVPAVLKERLGTDGSSALAGFLQESVNQQIERVVQQSEERIVAFVRQELNPIRQELAGLGQRQAAFEGEFTGIRQELAGVRQEIAILRAEMRQDLVGGLANQRADLMKWMFTFWIGQAAVTVGLILAIVQF